MEGSKVTYGFKNVYKDDDGFLYHSLCYDKRGVNKGRMLVLDMVDGIQSLLKCMDCGAIEKLVNWEDN